MILIATLKGHTYFSEIYIPNLINKKKIGVELTDGVKKNIRFTKILFFFFCRFFFGFGLFWIFVSMFSNRTRFQDFFFLFQFNFNIKNFTIGKTAYPWFFLF
jgi:hypothetical protein